MERITKSELEDLYNKGYDYISGKNFFGQPEYVLLNKDIAELELVSDNTYDDEEETNDNLDDNWMSEV